MEMDKNLRNTQIADLLKAIAASYEIKDADKNRFRIIAYENAATAVEHLSSEAKDLWDEGKLDDVSGIGKSIESHLGEIFTKGRSKHFEEVLKDIPRSVFKMIEVSGIGPKTAIKLAEELKISDKKPLEDLLKKAEKGRIRELDGFGEDSERSIIQSIKEVEGRENRMLLNYAEEKANELIEYMKKDKNTVKADVLGSLRRKSSTVGDIDISVATKNKQQTLQYFTEYKNANRVLGKGEASASIILPGDKQVDLKVSDIDSYGALLQHFTGSKHHNIALREYAQKKDLSLSEYGIREIKKQKSESKKKDKNSKLIKFKSENDFYEYLGMEWIPPELREDRGEIKAAKENMLPNLIEIKDIKADLQIHSDFDIETSHDLGQSTMEDIVKKADELDYEYVAFTEHNPSQKGHDDKDFLKILRNKKDLVDELNDKLKVSSGSCKKVFNSLEIDILPDGSLPVPDSALELLDFALISIHSSFSYNKNKMTDRVLKAFSHPKAKIFAHPTARKINERESIELDWDKIFQFSLDNKKWIEINADPMRLDLPDFLVKEAVEKGVKLTMGTDAHYVTHMDNMKYAVYVARRGWATINDIINTTSLNEFTEMICDIK
ncbi:hypothetical protein JXA63_04315 [Candidatus Woesebacteria bacterium]|nr:hypothetical protein [Candidatus Woesebacteria bacterium]